MLATTAPFRFNIDGLQVGLTVTVEQGLDHLTVTVEQGLDHLTVTVEQGLDHLTVTVEQDLDHRDFFLCEACFWCASYIDHASASRCPVCKSSRLARLPVK